MKSHEERRDKAASTSGPVAAEQAAPSRTIASRSVAPGRAFPATTGRGSDLPDQLRAGIEQLSGFSLSGVSVHYGSALPAQVGAAAFTQGRDIHLAPGQESHLPHEVWHVVQQAQGRVRPTLRLEGGQAVNDDGALEREAETMGERATHLTPAEQPVAVRPLPSVAADAPVQMVKIVALRAVWKVTLSTKPDDYVLQRNESEATNSQILEYTGDDVDILARKQELVEEGRRSAARKEARDKRRKDHWAAHGPRGHEGKQISFPVVLDDGGDTAALVYRGMSVNNINNMQKNKAAILSVQKPKGTATPIQHIVDDSEDSPYLSFEEGGLGVSAGKYAHKPVDDKNRPLDVQTRSGGFLKQKKSYTVESQAEHNGRKRLGQVAGIPKRDEHLDVSTKTKASAKLVASDGSSTALEKRQKAVDLATADREILVRPGEGGIGADGVPFVATVKVVPKEYFVRNFIHQTPTKVLGFYKPFKGEPVYVKLQVKKGNYTFQVPPELSRDEEDSESEMSDVEEMDLKGF